MNKSLLNRAIKTALNTTLFTSIAFTSTAGLAQDLAQEATPTDDTKELEVIRITGSHIKGVDLEGNQPIISISAEDIKKSGASTISELLRTIGATRGGDGSFSTSESGGTSTSTPAGQAAVSLRGLGPASTLTLINGRRIAASSFASGTQNFVDVNSIPLAAIDRVDILATGASATYGADAVAGVINYILKKDYQGAEFNASYGNSFESTDEGKSSFNFVMGTDIAGGNLTMFVDRFDRADFKASDRSFTKDPTLVNSYSYLPKLPYPNIYYESSYDLVELPNPNCQTDLVTTEFGEEICAYYGNEDDVLTPKFESTSAGFMFTTQLGNIDWNTDFFISNTKSTAQSSPAGINDIDDGEGAWADWSTLPDAIDPYDMYPEYYDTLLGREGYGYKFDARFTAPRTIEVENNAVRLVSTLSGDIGDWFWETGVTYSQSQSEQVATKGIYNRYKFNAATAGELCSTGNLAALNDLDDAVCSSGSLMPMFNPFLVGDSSNDSLLALAQEKPTRDGESTVFGLDAKMSGELFEFNGEFISAAFGLEYRQEEITDTPSVNARADFDKGYLVDVYGFGSSLSAADRTQYAAFAELYIPINDQIEVQLAGRFDDYDDFGNTFNPKASISYRPNEDLIFRGSWATSFRAPSLTQAGIELRTTSATYDCGANSTIAALYCEGFGEERSPNVLELGNSNLQAEESESLSVGFGWSPTKQTNITFDYWSFKHENIVDTDMTGTMVAALTDANLRHCDIVPTGEMGISYDPYLCDYTDTNGNTIEDDGANLTEILQQWNEFEEPRYNELPLWRDHIIQLTNTGTQEVAGIDVAADHTFEIGQSSLYFAFDATHYLKFDRNKPGSDLIEELMGTYRYPENIVSFKAEYAANNWFVGAGVYYTGGYEDDIDGLKGREIDELVSLGLLDDMPGHDVASWTTVRLNAGYDLESTLIRFTIDNLTNEKPPVIYGSKRGFDSINHNALGATYNLSLTYFFK